MKDTYYRCISKGKNVRTKLMSITLINLILLSVLISGLDFKLNADSFNIKVDDPSTSRYNENSPRSGNFDWGQIEVISEPVPGQNINQKGGWRPKIAVENDKIYVVWQDNFNINGAGDDPDILYRYFDGNSWSNIQVISEPVQGQNNNVADSYTPEIAVENGKIYVIWDDYEDINNAGTDRDIFFRCNLTGSGWEDIQVISEPVFGQNYNTGYSYTGGIVVENGNIYVAWADTSNEDNSGLDDDIFYRCNISGSGWEDIQVISESVPGENNNIGKSEDPSLAVENGNIYTVWFDLDNTYGSGGDEDIFYRCNLTGIKWEPIQVISEPIKNENFNIGTSRDPDVAVENGKIYVVWVDENDTNKASTDRDIFYKCNLTGSNWESVQIISEPIIGQNQNTEYSANPEIVVKNGIIYVVWQDGTSITNSGTDSDIFLRGNLTGLEWESTQIISEPRIGYDINTENSGYPDIAINFGKGHIIWSDQNDTNGAGTDQDIFYRNIYLPLILTSPNVSPNLGNTSTDFNFTVKYIHLDNKAPTKIIVNISGIEHTMLEVDLSDINYIDGKNYFFDIKNLDIGTYTYQFYASDGNFYWLTDVVKKPRIFNSPPIIISEDNLTAIEDLYYEKDYNYADIDVKNIGQVVTWNFSTDANWLTFDKSTAKLYGTPTNDDVGEYWVNVSIDDTMDSDFTNFTLTVVNVNDVPVIIIEDIKIIREDEYYENYYKATDVDSPQDSLSWNMQTNASWLDFEQSTAKLSGIPENEDVGESWVNISVSDGEYIDYSNFTLKVINVNDPPRIITVNNITAVEDDFYEMSYKAEDVDNTLSELFWNINTNAYWLNYNSSNAIINGTPTNDDIGEYWVNVSVSDNEYTDFTNFTLTVVNTNDPPRIITKDKTNATVGEIYSINYEAEDIDPPPITLSWFVNTNTSGWLTIDKYNGWLNGIPSLSDVDTYWVNVTVTDGDNGWDFHNFTLEVLRTPFQKNHAPQLFNASISPSEGDIKTEFTFSVHYYDEDGDVPVFVQVVIEDTAYNMKLRYGENASNGTYEYKITLSEGSHNYYFIAFDGLETVKTGNFTTSIIKSVKGISQERTSWFWLIWVIVIMVVIISILVFILFKKRKAPEIPTVKAELLQVPSKPLVLPSVTPIVKETGPLAPQTIVSEQLPTPTMQVQPSGETPSEKVPVPTLATTTIETQFQLPKATLSKAQRLDLLQERFLKGEVTEDTYKKLRAEIEAHTGEDITEDESEEQPIISEPQQPEYTQQPETQESTEVQHKFQQQTPQPQPTTKSQQQEKSSEQDNSQSS